MTQAIGFHLFPFRTEKLSLSAPMVLRFLWESRSLPILKKFFERNEIDKKVKGQFKRELISESTKPEK